MSEIVISNQIPDQINTMERLVAWGGYALAFVNPTQGVLETPERAEKAAQAAIFQAADNTYRLLVRCCLPIDPTFVTDRTKKAWMHVNELSNVVIPAGFTSN